VSARGPGGYGRYDDDPDHVGCPRARSSETPCCARDVHALDDHGLCVGCDRRPEQLLRELVREVTNPTVRTEAFTAWLELVRVGVTARFGDDLDVAGRAGLQAELGEAARLLGFTLDRPTVEGALVATCLAQATHGRHFASTPADSPAFEVDVVTATTVVATLLVERLDQGCPDT